MQRRMHVLIAASSCYKIMNWQKWIVVHLIVLNILTSINGWICGTNLKLNFRAKEENLMELLPGQGDLGFFFFFLIMLRLEVQVKAASQVSMRLMQAEHWPLH